MSTLRVIGIDPGPIPGIVMLRYGQDGLRDVDVIQCSRGVAAPIFQRLLAGDGWDRTFIQIERFVVGRRAGRSSTASAGEQTRNLIGQLTQAVLLPEDWWRERAAGEVKPWATDERLEAAGLIEATKGMRHARDAARHALFCAVRDGGVPDPLSRKAVHA